MPWGRRNDFDYTRCDECSDGINREEEEYDGCGECEKTLCSACMTSSCDYCKDDPEDMCTESCVMCELCMTSCDDCSEEQGGNGFYCHSVCLPLHRNKCSSKARALQKLENVTGTLKQKRETLDKLERELESLPAKISRLKEEIAKHETEKSEREKEFKIEEGKHDAAKKRKHAD